MEPDNVTKEIKIAAKQALEHGKQDGMTSARGMLNDIPQAKQDKLQTWPCTLLRNWEALENIIALQTNFEAEEESRGWFEWTSWRTRKAPQNMNYRIHHCIYTWSTLCRSRRLGWIGRCQLLFIDDEVVHEDIINQLPDDRTEHHDMVDGDIEKANIEARVSIHIWIFSVLGDTRQSTSCLLNRYGSSIN